MEKLLIQGDVCLEPTKLPIDATKSLKQDKAVAYGEHSGHAHVATDGADLFEIEDRMFVVAGSDGGKLEHIHLPTGNKADHEALTLAPNQCYEVVLQNQYNPFEKMMVQVLD